MKTITRIFLCILSLFFAVGCGDQWCAAEAKAHAVASTVLPVLAGLVPDQAAELSAALETAHAGVSAVGCSGDKKTLGEKVAKVAEVATQILMLYGQFKGRDINPVMSELERFNALADLAKLRASIARELR